MTRNTKERRKGKDLKSCPLCEESFRLQVIIVDRKDEDSDVIKCHSCRCEGVRKFWQKRKVNEQVINQREVKVKEEDALLMKAIKNRDDAMCALGEEHSCPLNVNDGYCCAMQCIFMVYQIREHKEIPPTAKPTENLK